jgi:hypothetical protein
MPHCPQKRGSLESKATQQKTLGGTLHRTIVVRQSAMASD